MIIHFRAALLEQFAKDTHYRNRSEITPTFSRLHWETPMFSGAYKNAKAASLVKYGTLNPVKDPMGVRSAYGYGESYFILKRHVRYRATFSRCDSGSDQKTIATCEHYAHILAHYTDAELISVLDVASGRAKAVSTIGGLFGTYKEFQIHGPVEFARDVESVVLNPSVRTAVRGVADAAEAFCLRHGVGLLWMDQIEAAEI
ncbi:hypothetical protein DFJ73DRAFT_815307 [Zopfochytrium polystomum]|nr:hypothetical protein DFJ73DRAFT_815307 [Zopfochytrium polystomum]